MFPCFFPLQLLKVRQVLLVLQVHQVHKGPWDPQDLLGNPVSGILDHKAHLELPEPLAPLM